MRRLAGWSIAALALTACGDSTGSFGDGAVRFRAVQGQSLVLYSAPPLRELRRISLQRADTTLSYLSRSADGGFYALATVSEFYGVSPADWWLLRFDGDWHQVVTRPGTALVSDGVIVSGLTPTPDGTLLVAQVFAASSGPGTYDLLVLDPMTLQLIRRIPAAGREQLYLGPGPRATTGTEVLWRKDSPCPGSLIWLDVAAVTVTDSVSFPCANSFRGARTKRQLYLFEVTQPGSRLRLQDMNTGQTLATAADTVTAFVIRADTANGQLIGERAFLLDAATLAVRGIVFLQRPGEPPFGGIGSGFIDPGSGAYVSVVLSQGPAEQGSPLFYNVTLLDLVRRRLAAAETAAEPLDIVP